MTAGLKGLCGREYRVLSGYSLCLLGEPIGDPFCLMSLLMTWRIGKFTHSKPASDTKAGDGRYVGGLAERKLKFSRACRNGMSGAVESLTRTSPKSLCNATENGMSGGS